MTGINNTTGKALDGIEHLKQSIRDILRTPIGTRVMRRDYGSRLFDLIDAPMNSQTIIDIVAATADALDRWEPRLLLERVILNSGSDSGRINLTLFGKYRPNGQPITLDGIVL
ncbi:MAG: phage baseplate protein [Methylomonas sp.]|nr:MAG: phage baseplate protein [Methylomonas sp.]